MPRYVQQRDEFRCGAVGIVNALKWTGCKVTAKLIPRLCEEMHTTAQHGTQAYELGRALARRSCGMFSVRRDDHTSLRKIEAHLRDGMAVLVAYSHDGQSHNLNKDGEKWWHFAFITSVSESGLTFRVANYRSNDKKKCARQMIRRHTLRNHLRRHTSYGEWCDPLAWYLTKCPTEAR